VLPQSEPSGPTSNPYRRVTDATETRVAASLRNSGFKRPSRVEDERGDGRPSRFSSPLIKPDVRVSRIRLSDWLHREAHGGGPK
jgi:hypothetical protein